MGLDATQFTNRTPLSQGNIGTGRLTEAAQQGALLFGEVTASGKYSLADANDAAKMPAIAMAAKGGSANTRTKVM